MQGNLVSPFTFVRWDRRLGAGKIPAWESTWNYEVMMLVAKGIERSASINDATKIFAGIKASMPFDDPSLVVSLPGVDAGGGMTTDGTGIMVENGQYGKPFSIKNPVGK